MGIVLMAIEIRNRISMLTLIQIRIRIGIKMMQILMRILPTHVGKSKTFLTFGLKNVKRCVVIFSNLYSILKFSGKKCVYQLFHLFRLDADPYRPHPDLHVLNASSHPAPDPTKILRIGLDADTDPGRVRTST